MPEEMNLGEQLSDNSEVAANGEINEDTALQDTDNDDANAETSATNDESENQNDNNDSNTVDDEDEESSNSANDDDEPFLTFDDGTIMRSQAESFAKLGYEYQTLHKPIIDKLDRIAVNARKSDGTEYESAEDFLNSMLDAIDENLKSECLEDANGNEEIANELFNSRKALRDKTYNDALDKRKKEQETLLQSQTQKVADDFLKLQQKFPEIKTYSELPKEVKEYAAKNNVSLLEAKLVIDYDNRIAAEKARSSAQSAAQKSTGSQSGAGEHTDPVIEAMLRGARY